MKITAKVTLVNFDVESYKKAISDKVKEATREAAFDYLKTVTNQSIIPIWSNASISTFQHLASAVGFGMSTGSTTRIDRTDLGLRNSTGSFDVEEFEASFTYSTTLSYLIWNNEHHAVRGDGSGVYSSLRSPGPYDFTGITEEQFKASSKQVKFPHLKDFVKGRKI